MKVAILGSGNVGQAIGRHLLSQGHTVVFGVREPNSEHAKTALSVCKGASATQNADAIVGTELVFIALPWGTVQEVLTPLASLLSGKTVVDCTNAYEIAGGCVKPAAFPSAAEVLQGYIPGAKVVKAFNQLGAGKLAQPKFAGGPPWMGVAGDDDARVHQVVQLAKSFGFDAVPYGKLSAALMLEDMARIWIHGAYLAGLGPNIGFGILR